MCSLPLPQLLQASPLDCASTTSVTLLSRWSGGGLRELAQLTLRAMGLSTARRVVRTGASCIYANFHIITLWFEFIWIFCGFWQQLMNGYQQWRVWQRGRRRWSKASPPETSCSSVCEPTTWRDQVLLPLWLSPSPSERLCVSNYRLHASLFACIL